MCNGRSSETPIEKHIIQISLTIIRNIMMEVAVLLPKKARKKRV